LFILYFIWIVGDPQRADNANEHIDAGIRIGPSLVMLSPFVALRVNSAKHLSVQRDRPFAAAQGDSRGADFIIRSII